MDARGARRALRESEGLVDGGFPGRRPGRSCPGFYYFSLSALGCLRTAIGGKSSAAAAKALAGQGVLRSGFRVGDNRQ